MKRLFHLALSSVFGMMIASSGSASTVRVDITVEPIRYHSDIWMRHPLYEPFRYGGAWQLEWRTGLIGWIEIDNDIAARNQRAGVSCTVALRDWQVTNCLDYGIVDYELPMHTSDAGSVATRLYFDSEGYLYDWGYKGLVSYDGTHLDIHIDFNRTWSQSYGYVRNFSGLVASSGPFEGASPVPLPASAWLLVAGLVTLAAQRASAVSRRRATGRPDLTARGAAEAPG